MPRPRKCRKVCHFPQVLSFEPTGGGSGEPVVLTVDEYESIRLIDREGLSQEECGAFMDVARTTVQQVYAAARKKLAVALVEGRPLRIEGGDYRLCRGDGNGCACGCCFKQAYRQQYEKPKGENIMRIAIPYENGEIFQHFGHTEQFKVYDILDGKVAASHVVDTNGSGHGALAGVLSALNVDVLICGGIGGGAQAALAGAGIRLCGGVSGSADAAAEAFAEDRLAYNPHAQCNHSHEHHGENHACEDNGCGRHGCGSHCKGQE